MAALQAGGQGEGLLSPRRAALGLAALALGGCRSEGRRAPPPAPQATEIAFPAAPGAGQAQLAARAGRLLASWIEPAAEGRQALRFAEWSRAGWGPARTVVEKVDLLVNFADFPALAPGAGELLWAHWLERRGPRNAYDVRLAVSRDGGGSWSAATTPHRDGRAAEHGFVSLLPQADGRLDLVWLDGRDYAAAGAGAAAATRLMHAQATPADHEPPALGPEQTLDTRVCDCCQTAAADTGDGWVVAYRDRSPDEHRDLRVGRLQAGGWVPAQDPPTDGWRIAGCPVNGPALAALGRRVAVAWYTAPEAQAQVKLAFSDDGGRSFAPGLRVDAGRPLGRVDVVLLEGGAALVSWLEETASGAELCLRRVAPDGERGPTRRLAATGATRESGFPRLEAAGGHLLALWRDTLQTPARLRSARVEP